jgi:hypothetical protein
LFHRKNFTSKTLGGKVNKDANTKNASEKSASTIEQSIQGNASNRRSFPNKESIGDRSLHGSECTWVEKIEALKEYKTKNGSFNLIRVSVQCNDLACKQVLMNLVIYDHFCRRKIENCIIGFTIKKEKTNKESYRKLF